VTPWWVWALLTLAVLLMMAVPVVVWLDRRESRAFAAFLARQTEVKP
jgi:hypothetical protein